jgi:imidazolonepropionase-like amidohydrolase
VTAELLGMSADLGTLEAGKIADLIAVDGNPLEDVSVLENVAVVISGGVVVKQ